MNVVSTAIEYLKEIHPEFEYRTELINHENGMISQTMFPLEFLDEVKAFFKAWDIAWKHGYDNALTKSSEEYTKNIHEVTLAVYAAGFDEGFSQGKESGYSEGKSHELIKSFIPSDATNIEVIDIYPISRLACIVFNVKTAKCANWVKFTAPHLEIKRKNK